MKKMFLSAVAFAVVAVSAVAVAPTTSEAVPAFARQTGAACLSCHFQAIPKLSTFGRNFSLSGMRDMGEGALIEDDGLSLPVAFNASFLMKIRVQNATNAYDVQGAKNAIQYPDEVALLFGGRYGEHFGGLTEFAIMPNGSGLAQSKGSYVIDAESGPIAIDLFSGDLGMGWAVADPSNAVRHNTRSSQLRAQALEKSIWMKQGVTGLGLHTLINDSIFLAGGLYAAAAMGTVSAGSAAGGEGGDLSQLSPYFRAAYIAEVGGLELVAGAWWTKAKQAIAGGGLDAAGDPVAALEVAALAANAAIRLGQAATQYGIDLQLQGDLGDVSVGFYLPIVLKGEQIGATGTDITGYQPMINVAFGHLGVKAGYDYMKTKIAGGTDSTQKILYLGAWYSVAQNLELDLGYTSKQVTGSPTSTATTLVMEYVY